MDLINVYNPLISINGRMTSVFLRRFYIVHALAQSDHICKNSLLMRWAE